MSVMFESTHLIVSPKHVHGEGHVDAVLLKACSRNSAAVRENIVQSDCREQNVFISASGLSNNIASQVMNIIIPSNESN